MATHKYILVLFLWVLSPVLHPLHLTVSNVDFNELGNQFEVSVKIFTDDLGDVILQSTGLEIQISDSCIICDSLIDKYVKDNFLIFMNQDQTIGLNLINIEINDEAVFVNYLSERFESDGNLIFRNSLLNSLFDDQKNLVFVINKDDKVGYTLDTKNTDVKYFVN